MHVFIRGPFDCTNGVRALLIVCLGMCVTCFVPSVHVHTDVQYIEVHSHRFTEQTILQTHFRCCHYEGSTSVLTSFNSSTEEP